MIHESAYIKLQLARITKMDEISTVFQNQRRCVLCSHSYRASNERNLVTILGK